MKRLFLACLFILVLTVVIWISFGETMIRAYHRQVCTENLDLQVKDLENSRRVLKEINKTGAMEGFGLSPIEISPSFDIDSSGMLRNYIGVRRINRRFLVSEEDLIENLEFRKTTPIFTIQDFIYRKNNFGVRPNISCVDHIDIVRKALEEAL